MTSSAKFLFDTEFDPTSTDDQTPESSAKAKPKPQYTDDDLAAARGEGQQAGFQMGQDHTSAQIEKTVADALRQIGAQLEHLGGAHERAVVNVRSDAARLAYGIAEKLASGLIARAPLGEIERLIGDCLDGLQSEPRVVVRVADDLVDALHERIDKLSATAGFGGKIVLIGEPQMRPGDCRIEWADGGAERDMAMLLNDVGQAVQRYLAEQSETAAALPTGADPLPAEADVAEATDDAAAVAKTDTAPAPAADERDPDDPLATDALPTLTSASGLAPQQPEPNQTAPGIDE